MIAHCLFNVPHNFFAHGIDLVAHVLNKIKGKLRGDFGEKKALESKKVSGVGTKWWPEDVNDVCRRSKWLVHIAQKECMVITPLSMLMSSSCLLRSHSRNAQIRSQN
jgi:hypothetical protein